MNKYTMRKDGLFETTYKDKHGDIKHIYGKTEVELSQKLNRLKQGRPFEEVAHEWFERAKADLSPYTVSGYRTAVNRACEHFQGMGINYIGKRDVLSYLREFALLGRSQKVINNHKSVLSQIFQFAILNDETEDNPCDNLPIVKGKKKVPRLPAEEDDLRIIEATKDTCTGARMMYTMLWTGLRRGECAALTFGDIDPVRHVIKISKAIAYSTTRKPIIKAPKTFSGRREVYIPDCVLSLIYNRNAPKSALIFFDALPTKTELETALRTYQTENNLKCTAHQLRHTYATMLVESIPVQDAQHLLGHSTISQTVDIYAHCSNKVNTRLANSLNSVISSARSDWFESLLEHQKDES